MNLSKALLAVAVPVVWLAGPAAHAGTISPSTVIGVFSAPVDAGNVANDPSVGQLTYIDNTSTAVIGTATPGGSACAGSNTLCWGTAPDLMIPSNQQYSQLTFTGTSGYTGTGQIGTIQFLNGTSDLTSIVFGATLSFYLNSVSDPNFLGSDNVIITTTSNQYGGTGLTPAQLQADADYVNICGNLSNICGSSIEAYEDSEGGTSLIVDLNATLVGDPMLDLTSITVDPLTDPNTGGVVGSLAPLGAVPEPAPLLLISGGLIAIGLLRRRS